MGAPAYSARRNRLIAAALALFAVAQGVWLVGEYAEERTLAAEREAMARSETVPPILRQEAESALRYLSYVQSQAEQVLKERIRERVDEAVAVATSIYDQGKDKVPLPVLRTMIRESLRTPRFFDGRGYYFIDGLDGMCVLLPTAPEREGSSLLDNRDDAGAYIMRDLIRAVQQPGGAGYVRYRWYAPRSASRMEEKIAYARAFPQLGWLIGTGDYQSMVEEDLKAEALRRLRSVSFATEGSLVVIDEAGIVRLFRDSPEAEGRAVDTLPDGPERRALEAIRAAPGNGREDARFDWAAASTGRTVPRAAWVARSPTWGWTLAAVATAPQSVAREDGPLGGAWWHLAIPAALLLLSLAAAAAVLLSEEECAEQADAR